MADEQELTYEETKEVLDKLLDLAHQRPAEIGRYVYILVNAREDAPVWGPLVNKPSKQQFMIEALREIISSLRKLGLDTTEST